jgi:flagellar hook-basal body complex protein FliE
MEALQLQLQNRADLAGPAEGGAKASETSVSSDSDHLFQDAFESVRNAMEDADQKGTDAVLGRGGLHTAMIAMTRADLSFRFLTQVRNKAVEAYREMMSLQF